MAATDNDSPFHHYFKLVEANTESLREAVYRIRYEVYCRELHYENSEEFPNRLEIDDFDKRSRHCLLWHRRSASYAGCVRMVFNHQNRPDEMLPFERNCGTSLLPEARKLMPRDRTRIGEASRLAITSQFRRRKSDAESPLGEISEHHDSIEADKRKFSCIAPGLYLAAASIALHAGLQGVVAMMEPRLVRHLMRYGIRFQQIGTLIDYHGPRAAFYVNLETLYDGLTDDMKYLYDIIDADLGYEHAH